MYKIGDKVWLACYKTVEKTKVCPDCCGNKTLLITMGDNSQLTIPCSACMDGYFEGSRGFLRYLSGEPQAIEITLEGLEIRNNREQYYFNNNHIAEPQNIFTDKTSALLQSQELAKSVEENELKRLSYKQKDHKSWSWHVSYYRGIIRQAEKDIERAKERLNVAMSKSKAGVEG
jgi:hypothetical protein